MTIDQTTFNDLNIFNTIDDDCVFKRFDFTVTNNGKYFLQELFTKPLKSIESIADTQKTIQTLQNISQKFSSKINNGTLLVIEKFYETHINSYPRNCGLFNSFCYKIFSKTDYSLTKYSLQHFHTFISGIADIEVLLESNKSQKINDWKQKIQQLLNKDWIKAFAGLKSIDELRVDTILKYANNFKHFYKQNCLQLIEIYCWLDAYISIGIAGSQNNLQYPVFIENDLPFIEAKKLYHLLLQDAVDYDIELNNENNFLFLTGANMAGKSTFIKAIGVAAYLAHLGFPTPSKYLKISLLDGLLSNINIADNIFKNESYFFNEVQRIKATIEKVSNSKKWLILIDELFKGTNIQDAMKCSKVVIEGLLKKQNSVFVLSTHLYEIGYELKHHKNIQFKYFKTSIINKELQFSYQITTGISDDKFGYLILEKEGVIDLLV